MRSYILHCKFATDQYVLLSWYNRHLVNYDEVVPWFETMFKTVQIKFMECLLLKVTPSILVHTFNRAFIGMFYCSLSFLSKHNIGYDNLLLFVNSHCFLGPKWKQKKTNYCNVFFFYVIWPVFSRSNTTMWNQCKWSNIFISRKMQVSRSLYLHNFPEKNGVWMCRNILEAWLHFHFPINLPSKISNIPSLPSKIV